MEKIPNNLEDRENESEEENEELPVQKKKRKLDLNPEKIKFEYERYLNCKLKYPKSQFCYFYFKGTCTLGNKCQFCHGYSEFSMDRYLTFLKDKDAIENGDQHFYQKFYFDQVISEDDYTYDSLLEYQNNHKDEFKNIYTFEELKESRPKRIIIRKALSLNLIEQFLTELFDRFNTIKLEDLNYYIYNVGYPSSIKKLLKTTKTCFSKTIKEQKKSVTYYIKNYTPDEMMVTFINSTIEYMKTGKFEDYFPLNYGRLSKILFLRNKKFEPNLTLYRNQTNINEKDFLNIFIEKLIDESNKGNFDLIKNKTKNDLLENGILPCNKELENKLNELNINKFNYFIFEEIFKEKSNNFNLLKLQLMNDGYLFYFNNENKLSVINYNNFTSFNINDFYNNNYFYKNCFKETDKDIVLELDKKFENMNINNIKNIIELNPNNIYKIQDTIINFINDENSLQYFKQKSLLFEIVSIDIEGHFDTSYENMKINLIQICDDTNKKNDIYVIDFYSLKNLSNIIFAELSLILKNIFANKNIKKIFFDGRSDLLSLHKELNICTKNFIDLSSLYNAVNSYEKQNEFKKMSIEEKKPKNFMKCLNYCKANYYSKGLNTVLKEYHSKSCINPLKIKYHQLFNEKDFDYWIQRPIIEEFLFYSALDVKYEFDAYNNLKIKLKKIFEDFYEIKDISDNNIDLIILLISFPNHNYACNKHLNNIKK